MAPPGSRLCFSMKLNIDFPSLPTRPPGITQISCTGNTCVATSAALQDTAAAAAAAAEAGAAAAVGAAAEAGAAAAAEAGAAADDYLYGGVVQCEAGMQRPLQQAHGVGAVQQRCDQRDVLGPGPGLQQAGGPALRLASHPVQNHIEPDTHRQRPGWGGVSMRPLA